MAFVVRFNHEKRDNITGQTTGAAVMIYDQSSGDTLSADLVGDFRNSSEKELIQSVLDDFYKRYFADKAMAEAVQTVDMLERQSKEFAKAIEEAKAEIASLKEETLNEIKANTERNQEMIKLATLTLNDALMQIEELLENLEGKNDETIGTTEEIDRGGTTNE